MVYRCSDVVHATGDSSGASHADGGSPLWMVSRDSALDELVTELQLFLEMIRHGNPSECTLRLSRRQVRRARGAFSDMIKRGEQYLHRLSQLIADALLGAYQMRAVLIGQLAGSGERFTWSSTVSPEDLYAETDLDFGRRQIARLRFYNGGRLKRASLVSNAVEYEALTANRFGISRVLTRVKAEEEIWNKVVDEIFDLDTLVLRDKKLRRLSRYVKDVFGVKIVVSSTQCAHRVQSALAALQLNPEKLRAYGLTTGPETERLALVEVKDYLTPRHRKRSGWTAIKSVVRWAGRTFEVQVQPLGNYLHERERLTHESHLSFKRKRELVRAQIAKTVPLFGYYRQLLRWLFQEPDAPPPQFPGVRLILND